MKVSKAIEILAVIPERNPNLAGNEFEEATKLGIEALETIAYWNKYQMPRHHFYLTGVTKEDEED